MGYSIYDELTKRASDKDEDLMEFRLKSQLSKIKKYSIVHLSRVREFLPEYDDHSVRHAEGVLVNIDRLIGEEGIKNLSVYDLFILAASAYLHDWGMALTDYEKEVLDLAEREPLPVAEIGVDACKNKIKENESTIFGSQLQDALDNNILPSKESELYNYLSDLYQKYQNYRNGYTEKYRTAKDDKEKDSLNKNIRQEFIRDTHHTRSADYVNNWGNHIQKDDINLSSVMYDVARVVQSHGESPEFVKDLNPVTDYEAIDDEEGSDDANLQFASTMLRLGDIVHFTFDRAPVSLRKEILLPPNSRIHWISKNGVSNKIVKGKNKTTITFKAKCEFPRTYCYLKNYIQNINSEIDLFNAVQSNWEERYQIPLVQVVDHVCPLDNAFETKPDLTFTLNQNKIIELLMGVQLYADPYTCLRELYQNSLDACRFAIARRKNKREDKPKCTIEFGVKQDKGGKYIYCLDDGKGMSEDIIEHYFLKIGSSYYKSKEFYTLWSKYNSEFTPTSQFGIGILSCFMIGDRLEVVTKEFEGNLIFFGVDGPQETFYYWNKNKVSSEDKKTFDGRSSGTLVKVYLKEHYAKEIDDGELEKLELLKCGDFLWGKIEEKSLSGDIEVGEKKYVDLFKRWRNHIYYKIYDFVQIPFPGINVQVFFANKTYPIEARPHLANLVSDDFEKDKKYYNLYSRGSLEEKCHIVEYPIKIYRANYVYHSMLILPIDESERLYNQYNQFLHAGICVDGVRIGDESDIEKGIYKNTLRRLAEKGIFNFVGENKPAIKVDRCSFVNEIHIDEAEQLFADYLKEVIRITKDHVAKYNIGVRASLHEMIWRRIINTHPYSLQILLTNHFDENGYPEIRLKELSKFFGSEESVPDIMSKQSVTLQFQQSGRILGDVDAFLLKKLSTVKSITVFPEGGLQLTFGDMPVLPFMGVSRDKCLIAVPEDIGPFKDYDILDCYYPLVSRRLLEIHSTRRRCFSNFYGFEIFEVDNLSWLMRSLRQERWLKVDTMLYKNKNITEYTRNSGYLFDVNNDLEYFSYYFQYINPYSKTKGVFSMIIPIYQHHVSEIYVIEGELSRGEMDEIYYMLFFRKKQRRI